MMLDSLGHAAAGLIVGLAAGAFAVRLIHNFHNA
jgi:hypothetical protein